jgi:hypothetical protein
LSAAIAALTSRKLWAQDLAPQRFDHNPDPYQCNNLDQFSFQDGNLEFDEILPITRATAKVRVSAYSIFHWLRFLGRTANFTASLPCGVGNLQRAVIGAEAHADRSG